MEQLYASGVHPAEELKRLSLVVLVVYAELLKCGGPVLPSLGFAPLGHTS